VWCGILRCSFLGRWLVGQVERGVRGGLDGL